MEWEGWNEGRGNGHRAVKSAQVKDYSIMTAKKNVSKEDVGD